MRPHTQKLATRIPSIVRLPCVRTAKYFNRARSRGKLRYRDHAGRRHECLSSPPSTSRPNSEGFFFSPFGHRLPTPVILILHRINRYNIQFKLFACCRSAFFHPRLVQPTIVISEGHHSFFTMALLAPAMNVMSTVSENVLENVSLKETHAPN